MRQSPVKRIGVVGMAMGGVDGNILRSFYAARVDRPWGIFDGGEYRTHMVELFHPNRPLNAVIGRFQTVEQVDEIYQPGLPIIDFDGTLEDERLAAIRVSPEEMGALAADYLADRGFVDFGFYPTTRYGTTQSLYNGFESRLKAKRLTCHDYELNGDQIMTYIRRSLDRGQPHAVLAASDRLASQLSSWMRIEGVSVPEQVAILGVGNTQLFCEGAVPALSSIAAPDEQIGKLAFEWLHAYFKGEPFKRRVEVMSPLGVVERASTAFTAVLDPMVSRAMQIIREQASCGLNTIQLATQLGVKRTTLDQRFKKVTGQNPGQEIKRVRVEKARLLLINSTKPITTIAYDCGYGDGEQFARHFRKAFGTTPSAYRKSNS